MPTPARLVLTAAALVAATLTPASCRAADALEVGAERAAELIRANRGNTGFVLLDIRTPAEFAAGHIDGAVNIDYRASDFAQQIATLDRSKTYLVYCRTGNRSGKALPLFDRLGFNSVIHLTDGIVAWQRTGLPVTPAGARSR